MLGFIGVGFNDLSLKVYDNKDGNENSNSDDVDHV
jgi:hypothetical protein